MAAAVFGIFSLVFFVPLLRGILSTRKPADKWNTTDFVERCLYCGYVFVEFIRKRPLKCPQCQSYLEGQNVHHQEEKK
jgi:hypothetical protein